ncbi:AAA family ATPase [bacterium]|nr:AAA family ATPase [bacterium]
MTIKNVKINYYKSIKKPLVLDFSGVNVLIGQNNSGKSNIFDAIEFALDGRFRSESIFYEKADIEMILHFDDHEQVKHQFPAKEGVFILKNQERQLIFKDKKIFYNKTLALVLSSRLKRLDFDAFNDFKQIEIDWHSLHNHSNNLNRFKESLKQHFPKISATKNALDISYESEGLYEGKRRVTIDRMGSGFRQIFTILLYIFHPDYSIVMIDEPETHLHPAMIKKLLWAMQNSNSGQILFTTHSPLFIKPITLPQVVRVVKDENNHTHAFSIDDAKYNYKRLIQELNADNLEMFFTDKVLLVEGVSDKLLIRGLIDKFYSGNKDVKVIQSHGKGNMQIYLDLLNIFKIPYAVVLDRDVLKTNHMRDLIHHLKIDLPPMHNEGLIKALKEYNIFILDNGDLERNYPRKYQKDDSKSINALRAADLISRQDFNSRIMANLREIIESL